MIREGRMRIRCGGDLPAAVQMPYRPISFWIQDLINRYEKEILISLRRYAC